jgi:hypothetical protein
LEWTYGEITEKKADVRRQKTEDRSQNGNSEVKNEFGLLSSGF